MNEELVKKILACPSLPSLPAIALQVLELAQCEQVDIAEIARVISKDPALSSKILRTVNSSFYGRSQSVSTISHALVILGLQSVKTLVLGFSLVNALSKGRARGFKHLTYWRRSVYAATSARLLAERLDLVQREELFLAALLSDIGMLVLDQVLGDEYGEVCERAETHRALVEGERAALGTTHAEVSGLMAAQWKLPPVLAVPMARHHDPEAVDDPPLRRLTEVVGLAGRCADVFVEPSAAEPIADVRRACAAQCGLDDAASDALLDEICTKTREAAVLFEISVSPATHYESILRKANEALVELTLRTHRQAVTLRQQNEALRQTATMDALTGLANRQRFDEFLGEQFAHARSAGVPLSLLVLDIDHFKSVNDTCGHQAGDHVIRWVARFLKGAARTQDLASRYGGEEMCLVMPGTGRATAAAVAESLRRAIAARPADLGAGKTMPVTVSIGVASVEPGMPLATAAHLLRAADLALYAAKNAGRDRVKVFSMPRAAAGMAGAPGGTTTPTGTTGPAGGSGAAA